MLGAPPLEQLGFGLVVLVVASVAVLRLGRHDIRVTRAITPAKVTAGHDLYVGLRIDNMGEGPTPLVLVEDGRAAELGNRPRFVLDGLRPGDRRQVRYVLRPRRRGRWHVGPLKMVFSDPFGVARIRSTTGGTTEFLVYPRIERLSLPDLSADRRTPARSARRQLTGMRGEDFYTLRDYVDGDDLRRVHWPATAKRGRYMIRQEETPWQTRVTILLDDRGLGYSRATWERALEVTASVVDLFARSGYTVTMTAAHAGGPGPGKGRHHLFRCLDQLVGLEPAHGAGATDRLVAQVGGFVAQASADDVLVVVLAEIDRAAAQALVHAAGRCKALAAIVLGDPSAAPSRGTDDEPQVALQAAGVKVLRLPPGAALAPRWDGLWARPPTSSRSRGGDGWAPKPARA